MISEGLRVMLVGMTTVFAFLALLVVLLQASGWLLGRDAEAPGDAPAVTPAEDADDHAVIAVVVAAAEAARQRSNGS